MSANFQQVAPMFVTGAICCWTGGWIGMNLVIRPRAGGPESWRGVSRQMNVWVFLLALAAGLWAVYPYLSGAVAHLPQTGDHLKVALRVLPAGAVLAPCLFALLILARPSRMQAVAAVHRAFSLVERGYMEEALTVLRRAIAIDPTYGHAHNELSFVLGKLGRLDEAAAAARKAIECDPAEPKFRNNLFAMLQLRAAHQESRKAVLAAMDTLIDELDQTIASFPPYPPFHLAKAAALAASGHSASEWEGELQKAARLYAERTHAASGRPLAPGQADAIVAKVRQGCMEHAERWRTLPE